jgi:hypothetical protein
MKNLIGKEIEVHDYKVEPSKYEGERLDLQIIYKGEKHVTWTSSKGLRETMKLIGKNQLPIKTTIIVENERFQFS